MRMYVYVHMYITYFIPLDTSIALPIHLPLLDRWQAYKTVVEKQELVEIASKPIRDLTCTK